MTVCISMNVGKYIHIYTYINKISKEDELGMILFKNIWEDSYKSQGVFNVW